MARRTLVGIKRRGPSWFVTVRVHGHLYSETFPLTTPAQVMKDWRDDQIHKYGGETAVVGGSFADDISTYLDRVSAMPSYKQRAAHLELWAQALGRQRPRSSITAEEIEIVLQGWLDTPTTPAPGHKGRPSAPDGLSPGTVRKRRTALQSFFAKMDGKKSRRVNPVKGTTAPEEPKPEARHIDRVLIEAALAHMPLHHSSKSSAVKVLSLSKVRAAVIAATGIPPGLVKQIRPHDLVLVSPGTVRVSHRKKGGGIEARTIQLTPDGLAAFKAFHAAQAYGGFATESLNRAFKRGCRRAGLDPRAVHLYDLRHSFLTDLYTETRDEATVARMGLHAEGSKVTARYTKGAHTDVDAAAAAALGAAWARARQQAFKVAPDASLASPRLALKVSSGRKSKHIKDLRKRA